MKANVLNLSKNSPDPLEKSRVVEAFFQKRQMVFQGVETIRDWRFKVYYICHSRDEVMHSRFLEVAQRRAEECIVNINLDVWHPHKTGFIIIHEGATWNTLLIYWWTDDRDLHHASYFAEKGERRFEFIPFEADDPLCAVWDAKIINFENESWVYHWMVNKDIEGYMTDIMPDI
jgi:hypothetical protein